MPVVDDGAPFAAMSMYPMESLRSAWDNLYSTAARDVLDAPLQLRWDLEARASWLSPQLVLGMTCGWPLVTTLQRRVRVVGTFVYGVDGVLSHTYRSVIIANKAASIADLAHATLAYNSVESLSGYVSIMSMMPDGQTAWSGPTLETGSHLSSIDAVREGRADIASIDSLTWTYTQREFPDVLQGLVIIDRGPLVPHLPLIARNDTTDEALADWRTAFADVVRNPALAGTLDTLLIHGFVPLDAKDYADALTPLHRSGL